MAITTLYDGLVKVLVAPADPTDSPLAPLELRLRLRVDRKLKASSVVFIYRLPLATKNKNKHFCKFYLRLLPEHLQTPRIANRQVELRLSQCPTLIGPAADFERPTATGLAYHRLQSLSGQTTLTITSASGLGKKFQEYWDAGFTKPIADDYTVKGLYDGPGVDGVVHNPVENQHNGPGTSAAATPPSYANPPLYTKATGRSASPDLPLYSATSTNQSSTPACGPDSRVSPSPSDTTAPGRGTKPRSSASKEKRTSSKQSELQAEIQALHERRREIETQLEALDDARQGLEAHLFSQEEKTRALTRDVDELEDEVSNLQGRTEDAQEDLEAVEADVKAAQCRVDDAVGEFLFELETTKSDMDGAVEEVTEAPWTEMEALRRDLASLRRRYDVLEVKAARAERRLRIRDRRPRFPRRTRKRGQAVVVRKRSYSVTFLRQASAGHLMPATSVSM